MLKVPSEGPKIQPPLGVERSSARTVSAANPVGFELAPASDGGAWFSAWGRNGKTLDRRGLTVVISRANRTRKARLITRKTGLSDLAA